MPDGQTLYYHYYQDGKNKGQLQAINKNAWWGLTTTQLISELDDNHWDGQTRVRYGNGLLTTMDYDKRGNLSRINTSDSLALAYQYDAKGNIIGIDYSNQNGNQKNNLNSNQKSSYTYDLFNRLNKAQINDTQYQYSYDKVGNRTQKTQGTKKQTLSYATKGNRLTQINKQPLKYNAEGSPLTSPSESGQRSYTYNTEQRPIELYINGKLKAKYAYNGFGERIKKTVFSNNTQTTTYYLYDGRSLSTEANQQGEVTAQYLYHQNKPAIKLEKSNVYYIHTDHLGTPRTVTDEDQNTVWQANYSPFGQVQITQQQISLNLRFPGQYEDQESGTYYNYFRDYDPEIGRYVTSDPIGLNGGLNTYGYVGGNPVRYSDSLGLFTKPSSQTESDVLIELLSTSSEQQIAGYVNTELSSFDDRQHFYLWAHEQLNTKPLATESNWFLAASQVNEFDALGAIDFDPINIFSSKDTKNYLRTAGKLLAEHNIQTFVAMITGKSVLNLCPVSVLSQDKLLVEYEQKRLEEITNDYFSNSDSVIRNEVINDINDLMNCSGAIGTLACILSDDAIKRVVKEEFTDKGITYNQNDIKHRILLGKRLIEINNGSD